MVTFREVESCCEYASSLQGSLKIVCKLFHKGFRGGMKPYLGSPYEFIDHQGG